MTMNPNFPEHEPQWRADIERRLASLERSTGEFTTYDQDTGEVIQGLKRITASTVQFVNDSGAVIVEINENGLVMLPGSTFDVAGDQMFIRNILQHINLEETDDPDPPQSGAETGVRFWVIDANTSQFRIFSASSFPTESDIFENYISVNRHEVTTSLETSVELNVNFSGTHGMRLVTVGAVDSGGAGFRVLRVANS